MPIIDFSKSVAVKTVTREKKIVGEIIPTPFWINSELEEKDIINNEATRIRLVQNFYKRHGFVQYGEQLNAYIKDYCNSLSLVKLITYIAINIKFNSNKIILNNTNKEIEKIVSHNNLSRYINELEKQNIIRRTTKQNIYVVNHEMIFKGSYSDFIKVYIDTYKDFGTVIDEQGRVVLFDDVNYKS